MGNLAKAVHFLCFGNTAVDPSTERWGFSRLVWLPPRATSHPILGLLQQQLILRTLLLKSKAFAENIV